MRACSNLPVCSLARDDAHKSADIDMVFKVWMPSGELPNLALQARF
jgi:hypothetical protein